MIALLIQATKNIYKHICVSGNKICIYLCFFFLPSYNLIALSNITKNFRVSSYFKYYYHRELVCLF